MAINKNHEFEDLDGLKCAIVEKNATKERAAFLKDLLEYNNFKVIVIPSPPPKAAPPPKPVEGEVPSTSADSSAKVLTAAEATADKPETFTIGVTNVSFNPTNAIFGKLLRTKTGQIVTLPYWYQKETVSHDEVPYYETKL